MVDYEFNNTNPYWSNENGYNELFLHAMQNYFNDKLYADGCVTSNDVLTRLGFPVDDSIVENWRWKLDEDGFVDFGIEHDLETNFFNLHFNIKENN